MLHRHMGLYRLNTAGGKGCVLCHPFISFINVGKPVLILPVDPCGKFLSRLLFIPLPTAAAVADLGEKGHVKEHTLEIIQSIHLCQGRFHIRPVFLIVGAYDSVSAGFKIGAVAVLPHIFPFCRHHTPCGVLLVSPVVKDLGKISNDGDIVCMTGLDHFA